MNASDLKTQHPETYAAIYAEGVHAERDRVTTHMTLGERSGDMTFAKKAIREGMQLTSEASQHYLESAMNRREVDARQAESDLVESIVGGGSVDLGHGAGAGPDLGDQIVAIADRKGVPRKPQPTAR